MSGAPSEGAKCLASFRERSVTVGTTVRKTLYKGKKGYALCQVGHTMVAGCIGERIVVAEIKRLSSGPRRDEIMLLFGVAVSSVGHRIVDVSSNLLSNA